MEKLIRQLIPILHEDEHLLAVVKPAGVDVGAMPHGKSVGLTELLIQVLEGRDTLRPVNRLSRYESGILLLAKSTAVAERLRTELKRGRMGQEYTAIVLGRMARPKVAIGVASRNEKVKRKTVRTKISPRPVRHRMKELENPPAATMLSLLRGGERRSMVHCRTAIATTHALRAQLRSVKLRLLGDLLHDPSVRRRSHDLTCLHLNKLQFRHPEDGRLVTLTSPPPRSFETALAGRREWERPLQAALVRRLPCLTDPETDSYRLITGFSEDMPGLVAERYGPVVILQILEEHPRVMENLKRIARWYQQRLGVNAVYLKRFVRDRNSPDDELETSLRSPEPILGEPVEQEIVIRERGLAYSIRPYDGFSVGLFLDQRDNRAWVRASSQGKRVLNLFSYTCGFSIAAAAGGARSTVSVDLSPRHLEWGKANFRLNGLDAAAHEFIQADTVDFVRDAAKRGEQFDLITLDPPSFAHGRKAGRKFSIAEDLASLLHGLAALLNPGGVLLLSTNYRKMSLKGLHERLEEGCRNRRFKVIASPPLPIDFTTDPDHAKTIISRFE